MPKFERVASAMFALDSDQSVTVENVPYTWDSDKGDNDSHAATACAKYLHNNENLNNLTLVWVTTSPLKS